MITTNNTIPAGDTAAYIKTARQQWLQEQQALTQRYQKAWQLAQQANNLLQNNLPFQKLSYLAHCYTQPIFTAGQILTWRRGG